MPAARTAAILAGAFLSVALVACSSPTKPSVSIASALPVSPANGTQVSYYSQPVTIVITNGAATGGAIPMATIEVATDAAFTVIVTTQPVSLNANGQLTITLDHLSPATTYYWRVKTAAGDNPGVFSSPETFSVGPLLVIQAPILVQPLANSFQHKRPTFIVANAVRTGPPATLTYRFDVATDAAFSTVVASGNVSEGPTQTSFTPTADLISGGSFYWHVQASDETKGVASAYSSAQGFTTVNPDDGQFPYTLVVHLPPACFGSANLGGPGPRDADYRFDDTLKVAGDRLRFLLPPYDSSSSLFLDVQRMGLKLSGTISGGTPIWGYSSFDVQRGRFDRNSVSFSGGVGATGRLTATFDGFVGSRNCCEDNFACLTTGFTWTLTPR